MGPSPPYSLLQSPSSSSPISSPSSSHQTGKSPSQNPSHPQPMVLLHPQHQQQKQLRSSSPAASNSLPASSTTQHQALAAVARRPSPTDALKHLRPAIPSPNTVLASLLSNPDASQLDFLSLFDPPATLPSDLLTLTANNTKDKDTFMDDYYGYPPQQTQSQQYPTYPPRRHGLPSVSPTGATGAGGAPLAASSRTSLYPPSYPYANPYTAVFAAGAGGGGNSQQYSTSNAHQAAAAAAARLQYHQQAYLGAFRNRGAGSGGIPTLPLASLGPHDGYGPGYLAQYTHVPRSGINGYLQQGGADEDDTGGFISASHLAHERSLMTASATRPPDNPHPGEPDSPSAGPGVVNPSALDAHNAASSSTALTLAQDSTPNLAVRLRYAPDGKSLLRADHTDHPCHDPMVLGGRLVDMSVHMEHYLQDLLPRKGEDHSDWQPVDITFDILSSRLRQTLEQMERFRGDMTRKASAERSAKKAKAAVAAGKSATKRLQGSRAVKPVTAGSAATAGAARSRATDLVQS